MNLLTNSAVYMDTVEAATAAMNFLDGRTLGSVIILVTRMVRDIVCFYRLW